jgi:3-phytase
MSNGRVFHLYDWRIIEERIQAAVKELNDFLNTNSKHK